MWEAYTTDSSAVPWAQAVLGFFAAQLLRVFPVLYFTLWEEDTLYAPP